MNFLGAYCKDKNTIGNLLFCLENCNNQFGHVYIIYQWCNQVGEEVRGL